MRNDEKLILLFDLDGTLTDPKVGLLGCVRYAFEKLSVRCPPDDVLFRFVGPPLRAMFTTLLNTSDKRVIEEAVRLYRERYEEKGVYENHVYDGVDEMLADSTQVASASFVATSKPTVFAERIVRNLNFDQHFARIYGSALDGRFDDKADLLSHLLTEESIFPANAIMIGDRAADVIAAKSNGVSSIGVLWGYGSAEELKDAGADGLCSTPGELIGCLSRFS
jgi:phosphoglycolate phosphatase